MFCPECGSAIFWHGEQAPDMIGLAAGAFADPDFPKPHAAVWIGGRYKWVEIPDGVEQLEEQSL